MEINGQPTRVVTFFVPETEEQIAAWYAFWIDETSGHVVQEVMISQQHYMLYNYSEFDKPVIIAPPDTNGATPHAG